MPLEAILELFQIPVLPVFGQQSIAINANFLCGYQSGWPHPHKQNPHNNWIGTGRVREQHALSKFLFLPMLVSHQQISEEHVVNMLNFKSRKRIFLIIFPDEFIERPFSARK